MGVRIWDRLLGRELSRLPPGRLALGRFILLHGGRELSLAGRALLPGDYLAAPGEWMLWDEGRSADLSGSTDRFALPDETTVATILAIGARLAHLEAGVADLPQWLGESPLMEQSEMEPRLRRDTLDEAIDEHLAALRAVCHVPADRLRPVNRLVPVGAARRIVPATIMRLAGHSEDWYRPRPDDVEPRVVLTPLREQSFDFYENRVAARLVDHLWHEIGQRLAAISRIDLMLGGVDRYVAEALARPWRLQDTLFQLIEGLAENQAWRGLAAARRKELADVRDVLITLRSRDILPGVDRNAEIGTALRATNIFTSEDRYRQVRDLWSAWANIRGGAEDEVSPATQMQAFCRCFASYTALLLLHALDHLGALTREPGTRPLGRDGDPAPVDLAGTAASVQWLQSDVFEITSGGQIALRIVPLPHAITAAGTAAAVDEEISRLTAGQPKAPTLIVYPGSQEERRDLPVSIRLAAFSGCDAPSPRSREWRLLPVTPMEIDSVMRLARSLRCALERERHRDYPVMLSCSQYHARVAAQGAANWISARTGGLAVIRPPGPGDYEAAFTRLQQARKRAEGDLNRRGEAEPLAALASALPAAAEHVADFATCPVCHYGRPDAWRSMHPRSGDTYACACTRIPDQCGTRWELRSCSVRTCGQKFPVLIPKQEAEPAELDGDALDRKFGSQLTAAPCWLRPTVFICTSCGTCGEAFAGKGQACRRCTE